MFDPATLPSDELQTLETYLAELDAAADARNAFVKVGHTRALAAWLENPQIAKKTGDYVAMYGALAPERLSIIIDEYCADLAKTASGAAMAQQLKALDVEAQKIALAHVATSWPRYVDKFTDKKLWKNLNAVYAKIMKDFPDIIFSAKDFSAATALGNVLEGGMKAWLPAIWPTATPEKKLEQARAILAAAFPEDDIEHLHIRQVSLKTAAAAFMTSAAADTMVCGDLFFNSAPDFGLFLLAHEYQHRRQLRLVDAYKKGEIEEGTAAWYQARLFRANFDGGYLSPMSSRTKTGLHARMRDYFNQPAEKQANDNAEIASRWGGTKGAMIWGIAEKISRVFSAAARPVDKVAHGVDRALTFIGLRKRPKGHDQK